MHKSFANVHIQISLCFKVHIIHKFKLSLNDKNSSFRFGIGTSIDKKVSRRIFSFPGQCAQQKLSKLYITSNNYQEILTSHRFTTPLSCKRAQMLCSLPGCSGWQLVLPQVHWCFNISVSYTRPVVNKELDLGPPVGHKQIEVNSFHLGVQTPNHLLCVRVCVCVSFTSITH